MSHYRKIDTRLWNDEMFCEADPLQKLAWVGLLTNAYMTPLGAAVLSDGIIEGWIGRRQGRCWHCGPDCTTHTAETLLEWFREPSAVGSAEGCLERDGEPSRLLVQNIGGNRLVIIKNFLLYNAPDNPNTLAGWIESIESLPRSPLWAVLRDYLAIEMEGKPAWLFSGLLNPLADNNLRGLKAKFWERVGADKKPSPPQRKKPSAKPSVNGSVDGSVKPITIGSAQQEQEQEQEQEQKNIKEKRNKKEKEEISAAEKPAEKEQATEAEKKDKGEIYLSAKKRPLSGRVLREFLEFTKVFAYNKGKPEAADSWLNIVWPKDEAGHAALYADILEGAKLEAAARPTLIERGSSPKWMQGWISGRRWEYWLEQKTQAPNGATPSGPPITCPQCAERKPVPRFQHWESFLDEQLFKDHLYASYGPDEGGKVFQQNLAWFRTRRSILDLQTE